MSLIFLSLGVLGTSSCGVSKEELASRAVQAAINGASAYLTPITVEQERLIGQQSVAEVYKEYSEYTANQDLINYVQSVANKVIAQASRKNEINYNVHIINSSEINAFTVAGGTIFITTECLKYINNEAELAGVLAHEVGHNENKHPVDTIRRTLALQGIAQGALSQNDPAVIQLLASGSLSLILNGFSRKQETEADETGTLLLSRTDYKTSALEDFLATLLSVSPDPGKIVKLFSTHPGSQDRINDIKNYISKNNLPISDYTNQDVYKRYTSVLPPKVAIGQ